MRPISNGSYFHLLYSTYVGRITKYPLNLKWWKLFFCTNWAVYRTDYKVWLPAILHLIVKITRGPVSLLYLNTCKAYGCWTCQCHIFHRKVSVSNYVQSASQPNPLVLRKFFSSSNYRYVVSWGLHTSKVWFKTEMYSCPWKPWHNLKVYIKTLWMILVSFLLHTRLHLSKIIPIVCQVLQVVKMTIILS